MALRYGSKEYDDYEKTCKTIRDMSYSEEKRELQAKMKARLIAEYGAEDEQVKKIISWNLDN